MADIVDLSSYNLLIATPVSDGKPELLYQDSIKYTQKLIEDHGGKSSVHYLSYVADIAYARNKLFGSFVRNKEFTHMLMVDSDMGWDPIHAVHFLMLKRDFLAAVGCKKKYPLEFACNFMGDDGKQSLMYHEIETNVAEIPYVGGAFVMISRECAGRMVKSYTDLQYIAPDGEIEHAIFDPLIIKETSQKRRLSEDYAFCYRWRKIGGKVEAKMDVTLTHTGSHTFTGNLLEYLAKDNPSILEAKNG